jgi:DNA-binding transcriptional LysR family regulator
MGRTRSNRLELSRLTNFAAVVEAASFTRAAERLGITKAVVNPQVARLVRVLPDWRLRSGGIHVLLPSARFRPAKISRFLELLSGVGAGQDVSDGLTRPRTAPSGADPP